MNFQAKKRVLLVAPFLFLLSSSWSSLCWAGGKEAPQLGTVWGAALYVGQLPELKRMVQQDPALINAVSPQGMTPLMWSGDEQAMFLLDKGAKANFVDKDGENALFYPHGPTVIERLVKAGCDPNQFSKDKQTPLLYNLSVWKPDAPTIIGLLKFGADPSLCDNGKPGATALFSATWNYTHNRTGPEDIERYKGLIGIIKALVEYGSDPDLKTTTPEGKETSPRAEAQNFPELLDVFNQPREALSTSFQVADGEIALKGSVLKADKERGHIRIAAEQFTLPNGKTGDINPKKEKVAVVTSQTFIHYVNQDQRLSLDDLTAKGVSLVIVGNDVGAGKPMPVREIVVIQGP